MWQRENTLTLKNSNFTYHNWCYDIYVLYILFSLKIFLCEMIDLLRFISSNLRGNIFYIYKFRSVCKLQIVNDYIKGKILHWLILILFLVLYLSLYCGHILGGEYNFFDEENVLYPARLTPSKMVMLQILDSYSEYNAHVWIEIGDWIC